MQKYVNQLIEDIHDAKDKVPAKPYYEVPPEMEGIEYILEWENNQEILMSKLFKLESVQFPPTDKLTTQQIQQITEAILELWEVFNFSATFPDGLPVIYQYDQLVKQLDKKVQWTSEGVGMFLTWCDIDPKTCPFPEEFCDCKDLPDDDMENHVYNNDSDALAF